jgi:heme A synthase
MSKTFARTSKPNRSNLVRVVAGVIVVLSALGIAFLAAMMMRSPGPAPSVRLFAILMLANLAVNIVLGMEIIRMRLWAYYTWLIMNGLGIFTTIVYNHGRPSVPAVILFLLMLAGGKNYVAQCKGEDESEIELMAA